VKKESNNYFKKQKINTCRITIEMHKIDEAYFVIEEKTIK
jgi:hypothetical protein